MKNNLKILVLLSLVISFFVPHAVLACAPWFPEDIYEAEEILRDYYPLISNSIESKSVETHPILNQKYEVITPGWGPEYLLPVYFVSEGKNLPEEIKFFLFLYYLRAVVYKDSDVLFNEGLKDFADEFDNLVKRDRYDEAEPLTNQWMPVRTNFIEKPYSDDSDFLVENKLGLCAGQALKRAVEDYEYRKTKFSDSEIEDWVKNQDEVFENCFNEGMPVSDLSKTQPWWRSILTFFKNIGKKEKPLDDFSPAELLRYDQEYQRAAGAYYSKNYALAVKLFRDITNNKSHPHRRLAALSLGWCYIGWDIEKYEADLKEEKTNPEKDYIDNLKETQSYYEKMIKKSDFLPVKSELEKYLDFVIYRTDPARRLIKAEKVMFGTDNANEFSRNLEDFIRAWYKYFHRVFFFQKDESRHEEIRKQIVDSESPFANFLLEWEKPTRDGFEYSLKKYKNGGNPLWLILAVRQSDSDQDNFEFLKEEINKIKNDSPFYLTAQYYWLDLLSGNEDKKQEAKELAEKFINQTYDNNQFEAYNLFSDLRERLASEPKEALEYSIRYSLATYDENWDYLPLIPYYTYNKLEIEDSKKYPLFSKKAKTYLRELNSKELAKTVTESNDVIPDSMERHLKLSVFYRLIVLDDIESADLLAEDIAANNADLSLIFNQYLKTNDTSAKRFFAAEILIDYPLVYPQIDENFDRYANSSMESWMGYDSFRRNWALPIACRDPDYQPEDYFETEVDKEVNSELDNFLAKILLDYMIKSPSQMEAKLLSQIVDFCHYAACQNEKTSDYAQQAFQLLHNNYSGSYWAEQTPYWY